MNNYIITPLNRCRRVVQYSYMLCKQLGNGYPESPVRWTWVYITVYAMSAGTNSDPTFAPSESESIKVPPTFKSETRCLNRTRLTTVYLNIQSSEHNHGVARHTWIPCCSLCGESGGSRSIIPSHQTLHNPMKLTRDGLVFGGVL